MNPSRQPQMTDLPLAEALAADERGDWDLQVSVYNALSAAVEQEPENRYLAYRLFNHLTCSGRSGGPNMRAFERMLAAMPLDQQTVQEFILPCAACLCEVTELSDSWQVLDTVPLRLRDETWQELTRDLERWEIVGEDQMLVPWSRLLDQWWHKPSLLPAEHEGQTMTRWFAMRLDAVESDGPVFVAVEGDPEAAERPSPGLLRPSPGAWTKMGGPSLTRRDAEKDCLWELGVYHSPGQALTYRAVAVASEPITRALPTRPRASRYSRTAFA